LTPRRGDAPGGAGLPRSHRKGEAAEQGRKRQRNVLDAIAEPGEAEVDATLRPLARALLALAEQLMGEEAP
jgi:hypothetical protein